MHLMPTRNSVLMRSGLFESVVMIVKDEVAVVGEKLPCEVVERLLWRPEDSPTRLENSIQQYGSKMLHLVEVK